MPRNPKQEMRVTDGKIISSKGFWPPPGVRSRSKPNRKAGGSPKGPGRGNSRLSKSARIGSR